MKKLQLNMRSTSLSRFLNRRNKCCISKCNLKVFKFSSFPFFYYLRTLKLARSATCIIILRFICNCFKCSIVTESIFLIIDASTDPISCGRIDKIPFAMGIFTLATSSTALKEKEKFMEKNYRN